MTLTLGLSNDIKVTYLEFVNALTPNEHKHISVQKKSDFKNHCFNNL
jgi:hypothetical protein